LEETAGNMEPANGFEPLTCALRVRLREISRNPGNLQSLKIAVKSRLLRQRGRLKIPDVGECAPRNAPRKRFLYRVRETDPSWSGRQGRWVTNASTASTSAERCSGELRAGLVW